MSRYRQPKTILRHARDYLAEPWHWTQGRFGLRRDSGPGKGQMAYCAIGVIEHFADGRYAADEAIVVLARAIRPERANQMRDARHAGPARHIVEALNDASTTDKRRVLRAFDRAIAELEGKR